MEDFMALNFNQKDSEDCVAITLAASSWVQIYQKSAKMGKQIDFDIKLLITSFV